MSIRGIVFAASTATAAFTGSPDYPPDYPRDVSEFIERVAFCGTTAKENLKLPEKYWHCGRLSSDKATLLARYRHDRRIVAALNDHWRMETRILRVQPAR